MNSIWRIMRVAPELRGSYGLIALFSVLASMTQLLVPIFSGMAIDEIRHGSGANVGRVIFLAIMIFLMDFLGNVITNIGGYIGDLTAVKLQRILSTNYFKHLLTLPQTYFDTELSGKIINRLNRSISQLTNFMQMFSNNFLYFIISTIFALILIAYYSWPVALMLLSLYPIYVWMTIRTSNTWLNYQAKKNLHIDIASGRFAEAINQIKVVKSFRHQKAELQFFDRNFQTVVNTNQPQSRFWHIRDFSRRLVLNLIFFAVYVYVFIAAAHGHLTPGQAVSLVLLAQQIRIPIFTISFLVENTQRAIADSKDYFEIMSLEPEITDHQGAKPLVITKGEIAFQDVNFTYTGGQPVFQGLNFTVPAHAKLALVGESGEGKTTLTSLLLRLYEASSGTVLIDGQNVNDITQASLHDSIGVVFQDPALFSGTIRENIAYGRPGADDKAIAAAAKAANAHDFISKFEKGYGTEIGERGLKLSGGQKQRIAIARALLKDAPILILDEATSSLDTKSERQVQQALEHLMRGRTTLIIAHRLSTIQQVDTIVTIKDGKVDEIGSPQELAATRGIYAELLALQSTDTDSKEEKLKAFDIAG